MMNIHEKYLKNRYNSTVIVSNVTFSRITIGGTGRSQLSMDNAVRNDEIAFGGIVTLISG